MEEWWIYSADCHCEPLTDEEMQPGAVIEVCGAQRCRKVAEHHYLAFKNQGINPVPLPRREQ